MTIIYLIFHIILSLLPSLSFNLPIIFIYLHLFLIIFIYSHYSFFIEIEYMKNTHFIIKKQNLFFTPILNIKKLFTNLAKPNSKFIPILLKQIQSDIDSILKNSKQHKKHTDLDFLLKFLNNLYAKKIKNTLQGYKILQLAYNITHKPYLNNPKLKCKTIILLAQYYQNNHDSFQQSLNYYNQAQRIATGFKLQDLLFFIDLKISKILCIQKRYNQAKKYLLNIKNKLQRQISMQYVQGKGYLVQYLFTSYSLLSLVAEKIGNDEEVKKYLILALNLKDEYNKHFPNIQFALNKVFDDLKGKQKNYNFNQKNKKQRKSYRELSIKRKPLKYMNLFGQNITLNQVSKQKVFKTKIMLSHNPSQQILNQQQIKQNEQQKRMKQSETSSSDYKTSMMNTADFVLTNQIKIKKQEGVQVNINEQQQQIMNKNIAQNLQYLINQILQKKGKEEQGYKQCLNIYLKGFVQINKYESVKQSGNEKRRQNQEIIMNMIVGFLQFKNYEQKMKKQKQKEQKLNIIQRKIHQFSYILNFDKLVHQNTHKLTIKIQKSQHHSVFFTLIKQYTRFYIHYNHNSYQIQLQQHQYLQIISSNRPQNYFYIDSTSNIQLISNYYQNKLYFIIKLQQKIRFNLLKNKQAKKLKKNPVLFAYQFIYQFNNFYMGSFIRINNNKFYLMFEKLSRKKKQRCVILRKQIEGEYKKSIDCKVKTLGKYELISENTVIERSVKKQLCNRLNTVKYMFRYKNEKRLKERHKILRVIFIDNRRYLMSFMEEKQNIRLQLQRLQYNGKREYGNLATIIIPVQKYLMILKHGYQKLMDIDFNHMRLKFKQINSQIFLNIIKINQNKTLLPNIKQITLKYQNLSKYSLIIQKQFNHKLTQQQLQINQTQFHQFSNPLNFTILIQYLKQNTYIFQPDQPIKYQQSTQITYQQIRDQKTILQQKLQQINNQISQQNIKKLYYISNKIKLIKRLQRNFIKKFYKVSVLINKYNKVFTIRLGKNNEHVFLKIQSKQWSNFYKVAYSFDDLMRRIKGRSIQKCIQLKNNEIFINERLFEPEEEYVCMNWKNNCKIKSYYRKYQNQLFFQNQLQQICFIYKLQQLTYSKQLLVQISTQIITQLKPDKFPSQKQLFLLEDQLIKSVIIKSKLQQQLITVKYQLYKKIQSFKIVILLLINNQYVEKDSIRLTLNYNQLNLLTKHFQNIYSFIVINQNSNSIYIVKKRKNQILNLLNILN